MKTYLPTLVRLGKVLLVYCIRNNATLKKNLTPEGAAALDALLDALQVVILLAEAEIPPGADV
jgi:hypothetical protein